jgi:hypothetical protein
VNPVFPQSVSRKTWLNLFLLAVMGCLAPTAAAAPAGEDSPSFPAQPELAYYVSWAGGFLMVWLYGPPS